MEVENSRSEKSGFEISQTNNRWVFNSRLPIFDFTSFFVDSRFFRSWLLNFGFLKYGLVIYRLFHCTPDFSTPDFLAQIWTFYFECISSFVNMSNCRNFETLHNIYFDFLFNVQNWDSQQGRDSCLKINTYYVIFQNSTIRHIPNSFSDEKPVTWITK